MKFEIKLNGKTMMQTEDENCIYDAKTIAEMAKAGYKAYLNGRVYRPKKVKGNA
ncbi:MAG: hypothetical protein LUD84_09620 [Clostridiales bacterium]|nr:hypothetical protein [Clostridiales bacterium]